MNEKELSPLKKKIEVVAVEAVEFKIASSEDMKKAVELLSVLNKYKDEVTDKKEALTKPLNLALKNARLMFKPLEEKYEEAIESLRDVMSAYQTAEKKRSDEEAEKIAARVGEGRGKLGVETAVRKIGEIDRPEDNVATTEGDVQFRETKILVILDPLLIPRDYLVIDESKLLKDLKEGKVVAGASVEIKMTPVNYR